MIRIFVTFLFLLLFQVRGLATPVLKHSDEPCKYYIDELIKYAKKFRGTKYNRGGSKPSGFDCSGFVTYVYKKFNISLDRSSRDMFNTGIRVSLQQALPGDLIFFSRSSKSGSPISHVGIVIKSVDKSIKFIHSSTTHGVVISDLSEEYYTKRLKGFKRIDQIVKTFHFPYYPSFLQEEVAEN